MKGTYALYVLAGQLHGNAQAILTRLECRQEHRLPISREDVKRMRRWALDAQQDLENLAAMLGQCEGEPKLP